MRANGKGSALPPGPDEKEDLVWMFTFGSNMLSEILEGRRGVHPKRTLIGRVWGFEFSLCYRGVPCIEPAFASVLPSRWKDVCVWGVVYQITRKEMDMVIQSEGTNYELIQVEVDVSDSSTVGEGNGQSFNNMAFVLSSKPQPAETSSLTWSARYKDLVVRGAKEKHLPDSYIAFLEAIPHYQRCHVDFMLFCVLFPVVISLSLWWKALGVLTAHVPRAISARFTKAFLFVTSVVTPTLWAIHDMVPDALRHNDVALKARQPAGGPGEWFSSHKREIEMSN